VDSLLNFETVKYFNAEDREARRYGRAAKRYQEAAIKNESSLAWLNIGQSLITNLMMAGAMAYTVWGWSTGRFSPGDVVVVNTLLAQLFRPLDMLGMVYRTIRQGLIDMEAMFDLVDTPAEVMDRPGAPELRVGAGELRFENVSFSYDPERRSSMTSASISRRSDAGGGGARRARQVDPLAPAVPLLRRARGPAS
jgi:ATP-binding cassette subfamily B protein